MSRLPNNTSIFSCELYAIYIAISAISLVPGQYLILTDSLSSIQALQKPYTSKNHLVLKIASLISNLKNFTIYIQWIPSHMGIHGNESADLVAKQSLKLTSVSYK